MSTATEIAIRNGLTIREALDFEYRRGFFAGLNAAQAAVKAEALEDPTDGEGDQAYAVALEHALAAIARAPLK